MDTEVPHKTMDAKVPPQSMQAPCPSKPYGKKCAAQVSTLACSILRRTPWGRGRSVRLSYPMSKVLILWYLSYSLYPKG